MLGETQEPILPHRAAPSTGGRAKSKCVSVPVPGLMILPNQVFKFNLHSRWWWLGHHQVRALYSALRDEVVIAAEVSERLSQIQLESERHYSAFDIPPLREGQSQKQ
jgi:hypothetical protein